jgi:diadenosine tetraphosphate (Ap4A) HIT family hydrolase
MSPEPLRDSPFFPFEGELRTRELAAPVIPEPPRAGEPGGNPCPNCPAPGSTDESKADELVIWQDDQWSVLAGMNPTGLPMVALLVSREHYLLDTLPPELTTTLGPMIQRISMAIRRIDGVGRTHFNRFGDGSEHFHVWFLARPLGMMQLRGPSLAIWGDLLPHLPDAEFRANVRTVATALAEQSGEPQGIALP